jgi:hypothetical protein
MESGRSGQLGLRRHRPRGVGGLTLCLGFAALAGIAGCGATAAPPAKHDEPAPANVPVAHAPNPSRLEYPDPTPTPTPVPVAPQQPAGYVPDTAHYSALYRFQAPSVGIDLPVIDVGVVDGAMDAPGVSNANDPIWKTAFWLNLGAIPGYAGTATIAGHVTDSWGRAAGFWAIRDIQPGATIDVVRLRDSVTVHYRITDTHVYTTPETNAPDVLARLYGPPGGGVNDGVARISLVTCAGRFVNGGYDHRVIAYGEMVP